MKLTPISSAVITAGVMLAGTAGAFSLKPTWLGNPSADAASVSANNATQATTPAIPTLPGGTPNFREIVAQAGPAVVGVTVEGMHKASADDDTGQSPRRGGRSVDPSDPLQQFFRGMPGFPGGQRGQQPDQPFKGQGSGFIISQDGLILTNAHVVKEAKEVTVKLSDRREYAAKVLGSDAATDIAVLRIEGKNLPIVRLGDVQQLQVGDQVLAIGTPYGFEQTATQGIVSAKGRSLPGDSFVPFIQTDAAVNPGNSGGPLFDGNGAVVGINSQIYSQTGGFQGLSFAIPINVAMKVKDQIVATGKAEHARLGVAIQDLTQPLAESFGLSRPDGALVASVAPNSPAAAAGLKAGDVITEVNGAPIERSGALSSRIGLSSPGDKVALKVWRDKEAREVDVKLANADSATKTVASADGGVEPGKLGLALRPLTGAERAESHLDHGLVVEDAQGPSQRAGIENGDVLLAVNGKPVSSLAEVQSVLKNKPKSVALLVNRDGQQIFVPVALGAVG
jgi:serine protease Do